MDGFDLLGADGLASQYITLRVLSVDPVRLRRRIGELAGGTAGAGAAFGLQVADALPKMALDALVPVGVNKLRSEFGIEVEASTSNAPKWGKRAFSEFWPGLAVGVGIGGGSLALWKLIVAPLGRLLLGRGK